MTLSAHEICWSAGGLPIVKNVSVDVKCGEFLGIIGPNGSGKTSLMSVLAGIRRPASGEVRLDGMPLVRMERREIAQRIALVEQQAETTERITARQAVELGRTPYLGALSPWSNRDDALVEQALEAVGMQAMGDRFWHTLSGGERQRLHIGRALAQEASVLLLDEPTNHLDIGHQLGILELVREQGLTVVAALHDLNHAAMFCDRVMVMKAGQAVASGRPRDVLNTATIREVFGVASDVEQEGEQHCLIRFRRRNAAANGFGVVDTEKSEALKSA